MNEFWLTREKLVEVNETVDTLPLAVTYAPMSFFKWQTQTTLDAQWQMQQQMGLQEEGENDMVRSLLADTNPYLLALTATVSMLHTLFEMLAFKSDVKFWRQRASKNAEARPRQKSRRLARMKLRPAPRARARSPHPQGLSLRAVVLNCFFQTVIFLYLCDNDTSYMVLGTNGIGVLIEYWKISKVVTLDRSRAALARAAGAGPLGALRALAGSVRAVDSYSKSKTREYDAIATSHLLYVVAPLVLGYSGYSLVRGRHKGWYSWILSSLVGFIYAFGFVMMTPQLFINYKLKSVAHMPWRAMVYKSLGTFIDDLFAFVIKMPWMHRLSCLRDDFIFFIYLYQRWIYPVDKLRINEFGQVTEEYLADEKNRARVEKAPRLDGGAGGEKGAGGGADGGGGGAAATDGGAAGAAADGGTEGDGAPAGSDAHDID